MRNALPKPDPTADAAGRVLKAAAGRGITAGLAAAAGLAVARWDPPRRSARLAGALDVLGDALWDARRAVLADAVVSEPDVAPASAPAPRGSAEATPAVPMAIAAPRPNAAASGAS